MYDEVEPPEGELMCCIMYMYKRTFTTNILWGGIFYSVFTFILENTTRPKKICIPIRPHGPKSNSWRIYGKLCMCTKKAI